MNQLLRMYTNVHVSIEAFPQITCPTPYSQENELPKGPRQPPGNPEEKISLPRVGLRPRNRPSVSKSNGSPIAKRHKSTEEVYRVSYPCQWGCANCAFEDCLGPVKVHVSSFSEPKEKCIREIPDGRGQIAFPKSRRKELKGLIYDKDTYSLFPPPPRDLKKEPITDRQKLFR